MCTLAAFVGVFPGHPLVVAANRDEYLDRPATPPVVLRDEAPRAVGGRDLTAGGTWLGVTDAGLVCGVLNRRSPAPPDPACRSRGLLCLDLLGSGGAAAAAASIASEPRGRYNPFNVLIADRGAAFVASQPQGEEPRVSRLDPGLHLLTNLDLNDPTCPRIAASHRHFAEAGAAFADERDVAAFVARLQTVLADHATALDPRGPGSLCVHAGPFGTRSSTVVLVASEGGPLYFHADGPPCRTRLEPVRLPFN
ncbi:MAG TPA: NRDE family protein [Candidatus Binatus sp.]|nr:NRDE family protein [Candidatus Binatus sp.]